MTIVKDTFAHPAKPRLPHISDEKFVACAKGYVCLDHAGARKLGANKVAIGRALGQQSVVIDYYRCYGAVPQGGRPAGCASAALKKKSKK